MVLGTEWLNPSYAKVKYPLISLRAVQELLPPPFFLPFLRQRVCQSMCAAGIFSCVAAGEPSPRPGAAEMPPSTQSRLKPFPCTTPRSAGERTLIGVRGLEGLAS